MYDFIYDIYLVAGIAICWETPVYQDIEGNVVSKENAYGETEIEITHPEYILFADETGLNISSKDNGNESGTKFVCGKGQVPKTCSTTSENCCTVLPFTAATGEAVICAIIYMGKGDNIPADLMTGIDPCIEPICNGDNTVAMDNRNINGLGKFMPSGLACIFNGKKYRTILT